MASAKAKSDKAPLYLKRVGNSLVPYGPMDSQALEKFRHDVPLKAEVKERRESWSNREYWAVLKGVVEATGRWSNSEALHYALKLQLGFWEEIQGLDGQPIYRATSTAFDSMDESEFRVYRDNVYIFLMENVLPGHTLDDIIKMGQGLLNPAEYRDAVG